MTKYYKYFYKKADVYKELKCDDFYDFYKVEDNDIYYISLWDNVYKWTKCLLAVDYYKYFEEPIKDGIMIEITEEEMFAELC